jgi:hypothetical protein
MAQKSSLAYQEFVPETEFTGRPATTVTPENTDKLRPANRPKRYISGCDGVVHTGSHAPGDMWGGRSFYSSAMGRDSKREVL